jgi:hypothetical protein
MSNPDFVDRVLKFNMSLTDEQRTELVEIIIQLKNDGDQSIIPGVFLIKSNPPTEEDILKAEEIIKKLGI